MKKTKFAVIVMAVIAMACTFGIVACDDPSPEPLPHTHNLVKTDAESPTCGAEGNIDYWTCTDCGKKFSDAEGKTEVTEVTVDATGLHTPGEWQTDGTEHWRSCSVCHNETERASHTGGTATCEEQAECSVCHEKYGALGEHTGGTATCTEKATCSVCGQKYGEIDADNHDFETEFTVDKEAICTEAGSKSRHCSRCDAKSDVTLIEMLEHTGGTATCTEKATCSVCGQKYGEIDANNHDIRHADAKEPTCTEVGWDAYEYCGREGCSHTAKTEKPALGHNFTSLEIQTQPSHNRYAVGGKLDFSDMVVVALCGRENKEYTLSSDEYTLSDKYAPASGVVKVKHGNLETDVNIEVVSGYKVEFEQEQTDGVVGYAERDGDKPDACDGIQTTIDGMMKGGTLKIHFNSEFDGDALITIRASSDYKREVDGNWNPVRVSQIALDKAMFIHKGGVFVDLPSTAVLPGEATDVGSWTWFHNLPKEIECGKVRLSKGENVIEFVFLLDETTVRLDWLKFDFVAGERVVIEAEHGEDRNPDYWCELSTNELHTSDSVNASSPNPDGTHNTGECFIEGSVKGRKLTFHVKSDEERDVKLSLRAANAYWIEIGEDGYTPKATADVKFNDAFVVKCGGIVLNVSDELIYKGERWEQASYDVKKQWKLNELGVVHLKQGDNLIEFECIFESNTDCPEPLNIDCICIDDII